MRSSLIRALLALVTTVAATGGPHAGPNSAGTLVIGYIPSSSPTCGSGCEPLWEHCYTIPVDCAGVVAQRDGGTDPTELGVFATFDGSVIPRLAALSFGIDWELEEFVLVGRCPIDGTEEPDEEWPLPGSGTVVRLDAPSAERFRHVYTIDGYSYYGNPETLALVPHPTLGATFFDDSTPAEEDPIAALGRFGFAMDGYRPCADDLGACCLGEDCALLFEADCLDSGGEFYGPDSDCSTTDCGPTPVLERSWGTIKASRR